MRDMDNQGTPLGRAGYFVIPVAIMLAVAFKSFWVAVAVGAAVGLLIANVKAVLFVGRLRDEMERNPLLGLQAKVQGADTSTQIRFIFLQSLIGAVVFAVFTAIAAGIALFFR